MQWSNELLAIEEEWFKDLRALHRSLEQEVADNIARLKTNSDGVVIGKPGPDAILFNATKARQRMQELGKELIGATAAYYGAKAAEEALTYYEPDDGVFTEQDAD